VAGTRVYGPFLDWIAGTSRRPLAAFAYDWRRDNRESAARFVEFLEELSAAHGGRSLQVVAHSMGGLISLAALHARPALFRGLLFAGVPFGTGVGFLPDMHQGVRTGLNSSLLSVAAHFSFVSPYCFFPTDPSRSELQSADGRAIEHDWYDPEHWEREGFSVFHPRSGVRPSAGHRLHLRRALQAARGFRRNLQGREDLSYPPVAVLRSSVHPTIAGLVRGGPESVRNWDSVSVPALPGDGRVRATDSLPPPECPCQLFETAREHGELLSDLPVVGRALAWLEAQATA